MAVNSGQRNRDAGAPLLAAGDPPAVSRINTRPIKARPINTAGAASFLLIGDHAGNKIPAALGTLGISEQELARHIGWDIGIAALGRALARRIDAPFIAQNYSRLVIDCNRAPDAADAIPPVSDGTAIPGNTGLGAAERAARVAAIHAPYQAAIAAELARRDAGGAQTALVALHSFTPVMRGLARPWHTGILHHLGDARFALACLAALRRRGDLIVGDNEPYRMDGTDYTIPAHAFAAGRRYVEIEIKQDLLATPAGIARWARIVAAMLHEAADG